MPANVSIRTLEKARKFWAVQCSCTKTKKPYLGDKCQYLYANHDSLSLFPICLLKRIPFFLYYHNPYKIIGTRRPSPPVSSTEAEPNAIHTTSYYCYSNTHTRQNDNVSPSETREKLQGMPSPHIRHGRQEEMPGSKVRNLEAGEAVGGLLTERPPDVQDRVGYVQGLCGPGRIERTRSHEILETGYPT